MRSLEEVLLDLKNAEKEYDIKCKQYGIEEKFKRRKKPLQLDVVDAQGSIEDQAKDTIQEVDKLIKENNLEEETN